MVVDRTGSMQVGNRGALVDAAAAKLQAEVAQIPGMELRTVMVPEAGAWTAPGCSAPWTGRWQTSRDPASLA